MNRDRSGSGSAGNRPNRPTGRRAGSKPSKRSARPARFRPPAKRPISTVRDKSSSIDATDVGVVNAGETPTTGAFRVLIAVHRPRFRRRAERAAALVGWEVTALLNKQDPVGQVAKRPRPPDLLILSGDFGRQRDYAIFRAVQAWRKKGMKLIGMVDDCSAAPENFSESAPDRLCDICITPPYTAADLRALFIRLYEEIREEPAPPPRTTAGPEDDEADDD